MLTLSTEVTAECMYASLRRSLEFSDLAASNYDKIVEQMLLAAAFPMHRQIRLLRPSILTELPRNI